MQNNITISYAILACDESVELEKLLPFLQEHKQEGDEIIVMLDDENYTAMVDEVASKYADRVSYRKLNKDFASQKNALSGLCDGDYIFNIDADEIPHENLMTNLRYLIGANPDVDVLYVPRVNTVDGLTKEHIDKWRWNVNEKGWVNWPDWQMRVYRNTENIEWKNKVHEVLNGYSSYAPLPQEEEWSIYHHKEISRQEKQNEFYDTI